MQKTLIKGVSTATAQLVQTGRKAELSGQWCLCKGATIGWNEWRYGWEMWNYDTEWAEVKVEDYVVSGDEPGEVPESAKTLQPCGVEGELSC